MGTKNCLVASLLILSFFVRPLLGLQSSSQSIPSNGTVRYFPKSAVIFYADYPVRESSNYQITVQIAKTLVAYLDENGKPMDFFFDSWIITAHASPYHNWHFTEGYVDDTDLEWWIDRLFYSGEQLANLDEAMEWAKRALDQSEYNLRVFLAIPYTVNSSIDPSLCIDRIISEWNQLNPINLQLFGFYWTPEDYSSPIIDMLKNFSMKSHSRGMKVCNAPYMRAEGVKNWQDYGVDYVMQQPNYAYYNESKETTLAEADRMVKEWNLAGIHFELAIYITNPQAGTWMNSANTYLDAGYEYGWNRNLLNSFYHGADISWYWRSDNSTLRSIYDRIYQFVKYSKRTQQKS